MPLPVPDLARPRKSSAETQPSESSAEPRLAPPCFDHPLGIVLMAASLGLSLNPPGADGVPRGLDG